MEIIGKLALILPEQRGEGARGPWVRGGFVIDTNEQYSRKIAFTTFGEERISALHGIQPGTDIRVVFNVESREYQGRWYTDCRAMDISAFTSVVNNNPYGGGYAQHQPQQVSGQYAQPIPQNYPPSPQTSGFQTPQMNPMNNVSPQMPSMQTPQVPQSSMGGTIENEPFGDVTESDLPF